MVKQRGTNYNNISKTTTESSVKEEIKASRKQEEKEVPTRRVKVVNTEKLYIRGAPKVDKKNVTRIVNHGDTFFVKDKNQEWAQVITPNSEIIEFVMKKFLKEV